MCLIIHKPAGQSIDRSVIESASQYNPDGFGIMAEGKAAKYKSLSVRAIQDIIDAHIDTDAAIHFRMATDGKVSKELAHPFKLANHGYLMHNGVLSKYRTSKDSTESDTSRLVKEFCNPLILENGGLPIASLESEIVGSKVALMNTAGEITRHGGEWYAHDNLYFSNTYAWDSPRAYDYYSQYDDILDRDEDGNYWITPNRRDSSIADNMVTRLLEIEDMLPLHDMSNIYYDDLSLWDALIDAEIANEDFLECCSDNTLLAIYTQCVREGLITDIR